MTSRRPTPTSTSNFGVGRREAHDSSGFYARFEAPVVSPDAEILPPAPVATPLVCGDARHLDTVDGGSVALVVTSPPYFAGKQYEEELGREGVPASYLEYLSMLREVFAECVRKLEPGGRVAVNVANLGRKPYRSLAADVTGILQDDLKLLLRGEVVWRKGEGASGSCAWGSFRSPTNPVLRDITERVVIASKGRFDRPLDSATRKKRGLPHRSTISSDEFMAATLDVWELAPERATRVRHPAPFPVELPERLIRLHTFADDLVLDPFMGSGTTLVAAARTGRRYVGYDLDPAYVEIARTRLAEESTPGDVDHAHDRAAEMGGTLATLAERMVVDAGFTITGRNARQRGLGLAIPLVATDARGGTWYFDLVGGMGTARGGLARADAAWRSLGRAHVLGAHGRTPLVLLSSHLPPPGTEGDRALRAVGPAAIFDILAVVGGESGLRLRAYAQDGSTPGPRTGFWTQRELAAGHSRGASGLDERVFPAPER